MSEQRVVLDGVEAQLLEAAFLERKRAFDEADAKFAQRVNPIRQAHEITDGVVAQFALEDHEPVMRIVGA